MRHRTKFLSLVGLILGLFSFAFGEDYHLQYFLGKTASKPNELSKKERAELLNRIGEVLEQAQKIHAKLVGALQAGELDIRYQEGRFWMSKLQKDRESIDVGLQKVKLLMEKPHQLVASIELYKSLKDLSANFNTYNNMPSFSEWVGDLAPEMELWVDPVFYKLYLLPLAQLQDMDKEPSKKEKKPIPKGKKP